MPVATPRTFQQWQWPQSFLPVTTQRQFSPATDQSFLRINFGDLTLLEPRSSLANDASIYLSHTDQEGKMVFRELPSIGTRRDRFGSLLCTTARFYGLPLTSDTENNTPRFLVIERSNNQFDEKGGAVGSPILNLSLGNYADVGGEKTWRQGVGLGDFIQDPVLVKTARFLEQGVRFYTFDGSVEK